MKFAQTTVHLSLIPIVGLYRVRGWDATDDRPARMRNELDLFGIDLLDIGSMVPHVDKVMEERQTLFFSEGSLRCDNMMGR